MDKTEIFEFLNKNPVVYLATCENGSPHVRGMLMYRCDDEGIIFHTGKTKDLHKQLEHNPLIELCSFSQAENKQVRVSGKMEEVKDESLKKRIVEDRPFMKPWIEKYGLNVLTVWKVTKAVACVWMMETNFSSKEYIKLY